LKATLNFEIHTELGDLFKVLSFTYSCFHVRWVPCHHGMAHPQVAVSGKASRYGE